MHPTTSRAALVDTLFSLFEDTASTFRQSRSYHRALALALGFLAAIARHTLSQSILAIGAHDADWSPFYRLFSHQRISISRLQRCLVMQCLTHVPPDQPLFLAVDATSIPRSSLRFPGVGWSRAPATAPFRRGLALAQRFGALHWLPSHEHGYTRAIPILSYALFTPKTRSASVPPCTEWEGALAALHTLRSWLAEAGRPSQPVVVLADGAYDVVDFWKQLPPHTTLMARSARNRTLFDLPPPEPSRRGARRKYGERAPCPSEWIARRRGWRERQVLVRGHQRRIRVRVEGPFLRQRAPEQPLFLVLMGGQVYRRRGREKRREPVPVLVKAVRDEEGRWRLPLALDEVVVWLWQRWEVEVAHREMKSGFGVGEIQCWNRVSAVVTVQWGMWLYGVCLLAAYRTWGMCGGPQPPGRWRKRGGRWSFTTLWRSVRVGLVEREELEGYGRGTRGDWATKEAWVVSLRRTMEMSARL